MPSAAPALLLTLSGIDGAGKSTQIQALESWLREAGLSVSIFSLWDHVVVCRRLREFASRHAFHGDQGIGSPERPLHRRDKNVTAWPLHALRFLFYFADALSLCLCIRRWRKVSECDVLIFDRYIYDELANLPLSRRGPRYFARFIAWLVPRPDVAFLVDAAPEAACARKPEYPLDFVRRNRLSYFALRQIINRLVVIDGSSIEEMNQKIRRTVSARVVESKADTQLAAVRR